MKIKVKALFEAGKWFSDATEPWTPSTEDLTLEYWVKIPEASLLEFFKLSTIDNDGEYLWSIVEDHDIYTDGKKLTNEEILWKINYGSGQEFYFKLFFVSLVYELLVLKERHKSNGKMGVE